MLSKIYIQDPTFSVPLLYVDRQPYHLSSDRTSLSLPFRPSRSYQDNMELEDMTCTARLTSPVGSAGGAAPGPGSAAQQQQPQKQQLCNQPWLQALVAGGGNIVFNSEGLDPTSSPLYEELSADHLVRARSGCVGHISIAAVVGRRQPSRNR
jgi:hypothetical protein